jgi:hypothetical protein
MGGGDMGNSDKLINQDQLPTKYMKTPSGGKVRKGKEERG